MSHADEKPLDELTDTGKTVENEVSAPENADNAAPHWPEDESAVSPEAQLQAEKEKYLRLYSEFDNFKKRTARERVEFFSMAGKDVVLSMLPVVDDMERALKTLNMDNPELKPVAEGMQLVYKKLISALESHGLKPIESVGKPFDVDLHDAITKIPAPAEDLKGKVVDEVEKGYTMQDKVIRFAKVVVGE